MITPRSVEVVLIQKFYFFSKVFLLIKYATNIKLSIIKKNKEKNALIILSTFFLHRKKLVHAVLNKI